MRHNLFHVPREIFEPQVLGMSWLLLAWALFGVVLIVVLTRKHGLGHPDTQGSLVLLLVVGAVFGVALPRLCDAQGLPIRGYGVMLLLGVVSAVGLTTWRGRRLGLDPDRIFSLSLWAFVPGIIGARAFYVIKYWPQFQKDTRVDTLVAMVNLSEGGIVVYGSVIGGFLGLMTYVYKHKMPPLATLDLVVPGFLLGLAIGRLGCFLNGCCYGQSCDLPWAVTFPKGRPVYVAQVERGQMHGMELSGHPDAEPILRSVEPDSAAGRAGLRPGDRLARIGGVEVKRAGEAHRVLYGLFRNGQPVDLQVKGRDPVTLEAARIPPRSMPVHPTQLYSSVNSLALCLFLLAYAPFRRRDGEVWAMFLVLYAITRYLMEIIRTDEPGVLGTALSVSQVVSLLVAALAAGTWIAILKRPRGLAFAS
ncbi:MAG: prolipoprotein diacylglyceryl transferase family protein [Planctomycetota bacterium]|jgi:phosphatidylglycerol:prolipoprotein diacylglycerol transferase